jgi:imidazolonepropionase-like amidohydrolase
MGNWISDNKKWLEETRARGFIVPRLLYSGPLLDGANPAYPHGSIVLLDELDGRRAAGRLIEAGATSLKVYFRLPLSVMKAVIEEAHRRSVPVHGHLEVVEPRDAIALGLDGLEHTSSVGRALLSPRESEAYRQMILRDSSTRGPGRYEVWARVDPRGARADELIQLMVERQVMLDATLAVYEPARGDEGLEDRWQAVHNMTAFTVRYHRAGGPVVIGSHGTVPNAAPGFAFHHEMKILVEAGLSPSEVLQAATRVGAVALGLDDRGVIARGKLADLVILDANPLEDIDNATRVHAVVLDGRVVDRDALLAARPQETGAR